MYMIGNRWVLLLSMSQQQKQQQQLGLQAPAALDAAVQDAGYSTV
jgi:hypothetical protein